MPERKKELVKEKAVGLLGFGTYKDKLQKPNPANIPHAQISLEEKLALVVAAKHEMDIAETMYLFALYAAGSARQGTAQSNEYLNILDERRAELNYQNRSLARLLAKLIPQLPLKLFRIRL